MMADAVVISEAVKGARGWDVTALARCGDAEVATVSTDIFADYRTPKRLDISEGEGEMGI